MDFTCGVELWASVGISEKLRVSCHGHLRVGVIPHLLPSPALLPPPSSLHCPVITSTMSDLWSPRRRNTHTASSDDAFRRYNDVLPPSPRHRGRSQTRPTNQPPPIADYPSTSRVPSTASKLMISVKRSLSYGAQKKRSASLAVRMIHKLFLTKRGFFFL